MQFGGYKQTVDTDLTHFQLHNPAFSLLALKEQSTQR